MEKRLASNPMCMHGVLFLHKQIQIIVSERAQRLGQPGARGRAHARMIRADRACGPRVPWTVNTRTVSKHPTVCPCDVGDLSPPWPCAPDAGRVPRQLVPEAWARLAAVALRFGGMRAERRSRQMNAGGRKQLPQPGVHRVVISQVSSPRPIPLWLLTRKKRTPPLRQAAHGSATPGSGPPLPGRAGNVAPRSRAVAVQQDSVDACHGIRP
jgi:hypothetical protein